MKFSFSFAALCLSTSIALASTQIDTVTSSLTAVNNQFNAASAASDAEALVNLYADDTLWIAQGTPVTQGLSGPRELFEFITSNKGKVTHTIDHLYVADDASLAVMIGSVVAKVESVGMDATGTYLFVLHPEDDGWKIVTDMWHQHVDK